jgi:hypothetical protein
MEEEKEVEEAAEAEEMEEAEGAEGAGRGRRGGAQARGDRMHEQRTRGGRQDRRVPGVITSGFAPDEHRAKLSVELGLQARGGGSGSAAQRERRVAHRLIRR